MRAAAPYRARGTPCQISTHKAPPRIVPHVQIARERGTLDTRSTCRDPRAAPGGLRAVRTLACAAASPRRASLRRFTTSPARRLAPEPPRHGCHAQRRLMQGAQPPGVPSTPSCARPSPTRRARFRDDSRRAPRARARRSAFVCIVLWRTVACEEATRGAVNGQSTRGDGCSHAAYTRYDRGKIAH